MDSQFSKSRRSLRLKEYDYRNAGAYFVTVCTQDRECLFGVVESETIIKSVSGSMIEATLQEITKHKPIFKLDEYVIMPNHVHFVIWLKEQGVGATLRGCPEEEKIRSGQAQRPAPTKESLFDYIYSFKSLTTTRYIHGVKNHNWLPFNNRLWQRNYYERVVRNDEELNAIRQYIIDNPKNWNEDKYNPNT